MAQTDWDTVGSTSVGWNDAYQYVMSEDDFVVLAEDSSRFLNESSFISFATWGDINSSGTWTDETRDVFDWNINQPNNSAWNLQSTNSSDWNETSTTGEWNSVTSVNSNWT